MTPLTVPTPAHTFGFGHSGQTATVTGKDECLSDAQIPRRLRLIDQVKYLIAERVAIFSVIWSTQRRSHPTLDIEQVTHGARGISTKQRLLILNRTATTAFDRAVIIPRRWLIRTPQRRDAYCGIFYATQHVNTRMVGIFSTQRRLSAPLAASSIISGHANMTVTLQGLCAEIRNHW